MESIKGTYNGADKTAKTIFIGKAVYPISDVALSYLDNIEKDSEVTATIKDGKIQFVKLESPPVKVTDTPSQKKKYQGVTIGMCMNNATQLCIAQKKYAPKDVVSLTKELLEEMEREGL